MENNSQGSHEEDVNDHINKYLEMLRENRDKDHMEIVDGIESREKRRRSNLLEDF